MNHPSPEEAWAIAKQAADEDASVVWTRQIAGAWDVVSRLYVDNADWAETVFMAAYAVRVRQAAADGAEAQWFPSLGFCRQRAIDTLKTAISDGRLTQRSLEPEARLLLTDGSLRFRPLAWIRDKWGSLRDKPSSPALGRVNPDL